MFETNEWRSPAIVPNMFIGVKLYKKQPGTFFLCTQFKKVFSIELYRVSQEERSIFWEVIVSVILSKKYKYVYPIPNGSRDRAISQYSSKTVDKKEILRTVSNPGIYCSTGKVGTVY
jgi:hypothetical protein